MEQHHFTHPLALVFESAVSSNMQQNMISETEQEEKVMMDLSKKVVRYMPYRPLKTTASQNRKKNESIPGSSYQERSAAPVQFVLPVFKMEQHQFTHPLALAFESAVSSNMQQNMISETEQEDKVMMDLSKKVVRYMPYRPLKTTVSQKRNQSNTGSSYQERSAAPVQFVLPDPSTRQTQAIETVASEPERIVEMRSLRSSESLESNSTLERNNIMDARSSDDSGGDGYTGETNGLIDDVKEGGKRENEEILDDFMYSNFDLSTPHTSVSTQIPVSPEARSEKTLIDLDDQEKILVEPTWKLVRMGRTPVVPSDFRHLDRISDDARLQNNVAPPSGFQTAATEAPITDEHDHMQIEKLTNSEEQPAGIAIETSDVELELPCGDKSEGNEQTEESPNDDVKGRGSSENEQVLEDFMYGTFDFLFPHSSASSRTLVEPEAEPEKTLFNLDHQKAISVEPKWMDADKSQTSTARVSCVDFSREPSTSSSDPPQVPDQLVNGVQMDEERDEPMIEDMDYGPDMTPVLGEDLEVQNQAPIHDAAPGPSSSSLTSKPSDAQDADQPEASSSGRQGTCAQQSAPSKRPYRGVKIPAKRTKVDDQEEQTSSSSSPAGRITRRSTRSSGNRSFGLATTSSNDELEDTPSTSSSTTRPATRRSMARFGKSSLNLASFDSDDEDKNQASSSSSSTKPSSTRLDERKARLAPVVPVVDQEIQEEFDNLPVLDFKKIHNTSHPLRDDSGLCIYCRQQDSPHADMFKKIPKSLRNKKMRCGHTDASKKQCKYSFHVACVLEARPMAEYNPQYYGLIYHFGKLVCHDHVCQLCHTDKKMMSAARGTLLKVDSELRSFHENCRLVGSSVLPDGTLKIQHIAKGRKYEGTHCPACSICGWKSRAILKECENCVQTFHPGCRTWNDETLCRRCTLDEQTEYGKPVLVEEDGFFRVGKCVPWDTVKMESSINKKANFGNENFVAVRLDNGGKLLIKELRELQRVPTVIAYDTFHTVSKSYKSMEKAAKVVELQVLRDTLKARSEEYELNPAPEIKSYSIFHKSLFRNHPNSEDIQKMIENDVALKARDDIGIAVFKGKGRGLKALADIPKNTVLLEYVGEVISDEEMKKRRELTRRSKDDQGLHYIYETKMWVEENDPNNEVSDDVTKEFSIAIDAARHHNLAGFFNSSCEPNCKTVPDSEEIFKDAGDARYEKLVIVTTTDIHKDEELTINYQWKNLQCLCGTKSCHNPAEEKLWNV